MKISCPYCGALAILVGGDVIYPHRPDLASKKFWQCAPCGAYVGCHEAGHGQGDGTTPLGRLANAELRKAKSAAHAAFDPLWKSRRMTRKEAYAWLASALKIDPDDAHIGMFDVGQCRAVVHAARKLERA
jgi:hypothetical protein